MGIEMQKNIYKLSENMRENKIGGYSIKSKLISKKMYKLVYSCGSLQLTDEEIKENLVIFLIFKWL